MDRRSDYKMALMIETVVHEAAASGLAAAARKLAGMGVPPEVGIRVLTKPEARRHPAGAPVPADATLR